MNFLGQMLNISFKSVWEEAQARLGAHLKELGLMSLKDDKKTPFVQSLFNETQLADIKPREGPTFEDAVLKAFNCVRKSANEQLPSIGHDVGEHILDRVFLTLE